MYNDNTFMYILDMCQELDIDELKCLIGNIENIIGNKEEEDGNGKES